MAIEIKPAKAGEYLRQLRTSKGLTLQEVSKKTSINLSLLSKIELGERTLSLDLIPSLSKAYKTDFKSLQVDLIAMRVVEVFGKEEHISDALKAALKHIS